MTILLLATLLVAQAASPTPETATTTKPGRNRVLRLQDPPLDPSLVGARVLVTMSNGVLYDGGVVSADASGLVVDIGVKRSLDAARIKKIQTLRPAGEAVQPGDVVIADIQDGVQVRGSVSGIGDGGLMINSEEKDEQYEVKWSGLVRLEIVDQPMVADSIPVDLGPVVDLKALGITPILVSAIQPTYPDLARHSGVTGKVILRIIVDRTGAIASAKVVTKPSPFDGPSLDAVRRWRYRPVLVNGKATAWTSTLILEFRIREDEK